MESSSEPRKKPDGDSDDQSGRKSPTDVARINALKSHRIRYKDAVNPNAERVTEIQPHDVVLGRGKGLTRLEGSIRLRRIAQKYSANDYFSLTQSGKKSLIETVYREAVKDGGRFLIKAPGAKGTYLVVDKEIALQKVSNMLRRRKPIDKETVVSGRNGDCLRLDPLVQQPTNGERSHVVGNASPGAASMKQAVPLGNEVARLSMSPPLPTLDSLPALPYAPMPHLPNLATRPSKQMRMIMKAKMMADRLFHDALTIQELNDTQDSRVAAVYSAALKGNTVYPLLATTAPPLVHLQRLHY